VSQSAVTGPDVENAPAQGKVEVLSKEPDFCDRIQQIPAHRVALHLMRYRSESAVFREDGGKSGMSCGQLPVAALDRFSVHAILENVGAVAAHRAVIDAA